MEAREEMHDALVRRKRWGLPEHKTPMGISAWDLGPDGNAWWVGEGCVTL